MKLVNNIKMIKRRQEIKEESLIIGVDIGSKFHSVVFLNKIGLILGKINKLYNSRRGFDYLDTKINQLVEKYGFEDIHMGFEPTGPYWKNLIYHLENKRVKVHFIRTTAVKHQREVDESSNSKTDIADAATIANIVREGKFIDSKVQNETFRNLRDMGKIRAKVMKDKTAVKNRLKMLCTTFHPEVLELFYSTDSVVFLNFIEKFPFPEDTKEVPDKDLFTLLSGKGMKGTRKTEIIQGLSESACNSIGIKGNDVDAFMIKQCVEKIRLLDKQLLEMKQMMKRLLEKTKYWDFLKEIPGVDIVSGATLLGELGDLDNFNDPKEIVKFAGVDPKENSSGLKISKKKMSKKGRYLLRTTLYFIALRLVYRSETFKSFYERKLSEVTIRGRHLEKKEAIFAVVIKFIRVMFTLLKKEIKYVEVVDLTQHKDSTVEEAA